MIDICVSLIKGRSIVTIERLPQFTRLYYGRSEGQFTVTCDRPMQLISLCFGWSDRGSAPWSVASIRWCISFWKLIKSLHYTIDSKPIFTSRRPANARILELASLTPGSGFGFKNKSKVLTQPLEFSFQHGCRRFSPQLLGNNVIISQHLGLQMDFIPNDEYAGEVEKADGSSDFKAAKQFYL